MKTRPILFSSAMVRAILSGVKTQTRRVVKLPADEPKVTYGCIGGQGFGFIFGNRVVRCPYGELGDRLWVKETFSTDAVSMYPCPQAWYRADDLIDLNDSHSCPKESRGRYADCLACWQEREGRKLRWKPSIFMPRHLSRITLQVVSVRVERLNAISEEDAMAEGIKPVQMPTGEVVFEDYLGTGAILARAVSSYATLWEKINGLGSWALNPWVWVVEFRRVDYLSDLSDLSDRVDGGEVRR